MTTIEPGSLSVELTSIANPATARHTATETIVGGGPSTVTHDQTIWNSQTQLVAELGVREWLAIDAVVPFRVFRTRIRYLDDAGQVGQIENPFIHHHNETLTGVGDPWLMARTSSQLGRVAVGGRVGFTIPLGRTEPDPFELGDEGLPHEHSQFGSGTVEPIVGLDVSTRLGPYALDAFALTIQSLYANSHDYKQGDRYAGGVGGTRYVASNKLRLRATMEAQHETAELWHGIQHTEEGNIGRTDVLAGVEVGYAFTRTWHAGLSAKVPLYTHVEGGQLDVPLFFGATVGGRFELFEHHHAPLVNAPRGDWTGLDEASATDDGSAVELVPVPGRVTVFDFWAPWCKPCADLDRELAAVARRHPADIAVRKVNIVDTDSPAATKYLAASTTPHVIVFGRDGTRAWERSASPLALAAAVEETIAGKKKLVTVAGARRIAIQVLDDGYHPGQIDVAPGEAVTLVFTRHSDKTCATDVHFVLSDGTHVDADLPLNQPVEIPLQLASGTLTYTCGMNMNRGTIVVRPAP
ncbi:hypothetical protein BH11MYX2_BH11MYX2_38860 [soil metagenome]